MIIKKLMPGGDVIVIRVTFVYIRKSLSYIFFSGKKGEIHVLHFISLCALEIVVELPGVTGEFPKVGKQI